MSVRQEIRHKFVEIPHLSNTIKAHQPVLVAKDLGYAARYCGIDQIGRLPFKIPFQIAIACQGLNISHNVDFMASDTICNYALL